jgi:hypothetical protein
LVLIIAPGPRQRAPLHNFHSLYKYDWITVNVAAPGPLILIPLSSSPGKNK